MTDVQATRDQYLASMRDFAEACAEVRDLFIVAEFTPSEAFILLQGILDGVETQCEACRVST